MSEITREQALNLLQKYNEKDIHIFKSRAEADEYLRMVT